VGKIDFSPGRVVKARIFRTGNISAKKPPTQIEKLVADRFCYGAAFDPMLPASRFL
jgi:hypothetical protein